LGKIFGNFEKFPKIVLAPLKGKIIGWRRKPG